MDARLAHIDAWIFDLDNTLYPAGTALFGQIEARMTQYICDIEGCDREAAWTIQKRHFHAHGTTLSGLMVERDIDPHHFLDFVHDIDMSVLSPAPELGAAIARLPGRKLVFTNGDEPYARRVLDRLGLSDTFEAVHDIHKTRYRPKPHASAYDGLCDAYGIDPTRALFAEDMARNLAPAKAIGMATLWVDNGSEQHGCGDRAYVDYTTHDLAAWLSAALEDR
ncbi:pyrimidine 5'-nucleotidase [Sphingomonas baiyangensis]|uniref:Pyrimidine 5'-nucleotidase n=1 Tax=Sphingomonas baiyangensis TaxID=2572576 RepID=A0A4U1L494_9SPHN|nr:pyrimidine 5'-nucleotidase [Sphingomonas baiyangensis]TKD51741.1 pyrimidine 5'-nucleotidase [Sphingomonas baiyangensis]